MKWEIKTKTSKYVIESNSSKHAVDVVKQTDITEILSVKLLPSTIKGKIKKFFKDIIN